MKQVKITKKMLKLHPADLLVELGMVDLEKKRAYPERLYFSKEDYRTLRDNLKKYAKKKLNGTPERVINYSVGMDLLNYGPNESLGDMIRPGWALIED